MNLGEATLVRFRRLAVVASFLAFLVLAFASPSARADIEVGSPGTGAGETSDPRGVDVDEAEHLLYVADRGNNRIDVFDAATGEFVKAFGWGVLNGGSALQVCTEASDCLAGKAGSGAGQLAGVEGIAVDNDPTSSGYRSVYVFEATNHRVQKFSPEGEFIWMVGDGVNVTTGGDLCTKASGDTCGPGTGGSAAGQFDDPDGDTIAVGPDGTIYVGDRVEDSGIRKTRVQLYDPAGSYLGFLGGKLLEVAGGAGATTALDVDSEGNAYVGTSGGQGAVRKYDPSGNQLVVFNPSFNVNTLAVGPEDHVFVGDNSQSEGEIVSTIFEYDPDGALLRAIYGSLEDRTFGLAVYENPNGDIFAVELGVEGKKKILDIEFPPPGPVVYPRESTLFANPIGNTKATLHGKVNPEGEATTYHFEYITDEDFDAAGETFGSGTIKTPESGPLPADFDLHPVQAELTGLVAETIYHFRIVVKSAATGPSGNPGPTVFFETKEPIELRDLWSSDVSTTTATLNAEVNPLGIPATARFEYLKLSDFEATGWAGAQTAPAGEEIDLGEGEEAEIISAPISGLEPGTAYRFRLIATDRCKPEPAPLCEFAEPEAVFTTFQSLGPTTGCSNDALRAAGSGTFLPDCRGYEMVSPVDKNGAFIEPVFNISGFLAGLDQAAVDGDSVTYSAYKAFGEVESAPYTNQYLSRRGADGWQTEGISPQREGPSLMTYLSLQLDRQYKAFSADLCNGWVVQDANPVLAPEGVSGFPGLYRRDNCDPGTGDYVALTTEEPPNLPPRKFIPDVQGFSADGSVSVFAANDNLTSGLPNQPTACQTEADPSAEPCLPHLYEARGGTLRYLCVLPDGSPYAGACAAGSPSTDPAARNLTNAVSDDGSRVFWSTGGEDPGPLYVRIDNSLPGARTIQISSTANFWAAAADGSKAIYTRDEELFEYDVEAEEEHLIAKKVRGLAGASEDASRIYFASTEVLTGGEENSEGEKAAAGNPNLYLYEAGNGFKFIGQLLASDLTSGLQRSSPVAQSPVARLSRVAADGQRLAFMSSASLTGYDNKDAETPGKVAMEVYLYDAASEVLLCPSCNPTGARPEGRQLTQKRLEGRFAAARIPVFQSPLYASRIFSADGSRFYFDSFDALSPRDTNDQEDVYQWQAPGSGSCTTASASYHEVSGGCLDLVSSGQSTEGSELVDISSEGADVFFKTNESLVTQDSGLRDIYDARVGGGFPPLPPKPEICQDESCPKPPVTPPPASNPGSQSAGPGNPPSPKPKPKKCPKGKHKVKKGGKVRCVKNKKHKAKKRSGKNRRAAR
jgi:DNA-binding beta-propeller fold protein YncE